MDRIPISFYLDDTRPDGLPEDAFERFLDFVQQEGIAGESSVILSDRNANLLTEPTTAAQREYITQVARAYECGIDTHMELMTHWGLFDFSHRTVPADAVHEGLWLHEPDVTQAEYEAYFGGIVEEAAKIGVRFTGLTWPGCSCAACGPRYGQLSAAGLKRINTGVWNALLSLAERGLFRGRTVPCFISGDEGIPDPILTASRAGNAVFDLRANARDWFGIWLNEPKRVDPDYYISDDGESGRLVDLVRMDAPYLLFYAHWQGLNPATGVGWDAFKTVIARVDRHLGDRVAWMRPSDIADGWYRDNVAQNG